MTKLKGKKYQGALSIVRRLRSKGYEAYFVGGCVRDLLMGIEPKDYDIATSALAEETERIFPHTKPVGKQFGVMLVLKNAVPYEVATFRTDLSYTDGRHPDSVSFGTPGEDALRRDFTVNGLFYDPMEKKVIDFVGGEKDIRKKIIRAIGDPEKRFDEDKLRMLRAIRFSSTLAFDIEPGTWRSIKKHASVIKQVSSERIRDELVKILTGPSASSGLKLLFDSGLLKTILPEVAELADIKQPPEFHPTDNAFEHTRLLFDHLEKPPLRLAVAALLHDIGKTKTMTERDRIRFNNHDNVGADMAQEILRRLRFSNEDTQYIVRYIRNHMKFKEVRNMRESTLKRFMGQDLFEEEAELHRADCLASHGNIENYYFCKEKLKSLSRKDISPSPKIKGQDLIRLGYKPGPVFKKILEFAYNEQLENKKTVKKSLLKRIRENFPV